MEDVSKSTKPAVEPPGNFFKNLAKSGTFRFVLPVIISAHLGWYYLRNHMVLDEEQGIYVFQATPKKV